MTTTLDLALQAKHDRVLRIGDPDTPAPDPVMQEILWEQSAPLQEVYPDELERYMNLFFKYFPKFPAHVRHGYGQGFLALKGKRKDGTKFERPCYPDLIVRMLDLDRWQHHHPRAKQPEYFWVAMREPRRSSLKAIDLDNKEDVLGHYQTRQMNRLVNRPLPILTVDHMQKIKRVYDAFPGHIWCIMRCAGPDGHSNCLIRSLELSNQRSVSCRKGRTAEVGVGTATS